MLRGRGGVKVEVELLVDWVDERLMEAVAGERISLAVSVDRE